jgi:hypothetical protein
MEGHVDCLPPIIGEGGSVKERRRRGTSARGFDAQDVLHQLVRPGSPSDHWDVTSKRHDVSDCGRAEKRADGFGLPCCIIFVTPILRLCDALRLAAHRPLYVPLVYQ